MEASERYLVMTVACWLGVIRFDGLATALIIVIVIVAASSLVVSSRGDGDDDDSMSERTENAPIGVTCVAGHHRVVAVGYGSQRKILVYRSFAVP